MVLLLDLLLLLAVLLFVFRSFALPSAILASALLSTLDGFCALFLTRTTSNVASFMGMIMVIGIAFLNFFQFHFTAGITFSSPKVIPSS